MLGALKSTANTAIVAAGFTVGTVSTANTDNPALLDTLVTPLSSNGVDIVNGPINYTIYSPFFPPFFPPSFCSCTHNGANCSGNGSNCGCTYVSYSCVGTLSYEYYDCGCSQTCSGSGGYNPAYRNGVCGYSTPPDPCAGYVCGSAYAYMYTFTDCSANSNAQGCFFGGIWNAYGDPNCGCPATFAAFQYCAGYESCP